MKRLEDIDINLLVLLHWLLEEGSVTAAAKRIGLSQPAASRGLQRLRTVFSDELLVRTGRTYVPSRLASRLKPDLAAAIAALRRVTRADADFDPDQSTETIVIAGNDYLTRICLDAWTRGITPTAPAMASTWRTLGPGTLNGLATGEVDLVVIPDVARGSVPDTALVQDLVIRPLLRDQFVAFAGHGHRLFDAVELTAADLAAYPHVLVSPTGSGPGTVDAALAALELARPVAHRTALFSHAADLAVAHGQVTVLPERFAALRQDGSYRPLPLDVGSLDSSLVWHAARTGDAAHRWVRQNLMDYFKEATGPE